MEVLHGTAMRFEHADIEAVMAILCRREAFLCNFMSISK